MTALIQPDTSTGSASFLKSSPSASSRDVPSDPRDARLLSKVLGTGVVTIGFILAVPTATAQPVASPPYLQFPAAHQTASAYAERRRWTWEDARAHALAILRRAEARRQAITRTEASFYDLEADVD
jgi:hypothetical protein